MWVADKSHVSEGTRTNYRAMLNRNSKLTSPEEHESFEHGPLT